MRLTSENFYGRNFCQQAFTLVELMMAMSVGLVLTGTIVLLLLQGSMAQRKGYSSTTVEENAYTLQANIENCIRGASSGQGMAYLNSTVVTNNSGPLGYQTIYIFQPNTNGTSYTRAGISFANGSVIYTPNVATPASQIVWMTSGQRVKLRQFYISNSTNPDGSQNDSLLNVTFQMDDNGFSQQGLTNSLAGVVRSFSVQMRCD